MTSSKSASRARRRRGREPRTEPIPPLRTADWDATTIEFAGASGAGLPGPDTRREDEQIAGFIDAGFRAWDTRPPRPAAGYAATTGPMTALGRPAAAIGDALTRDDTWGPKLAPLPCGHCGTPPPVPPGILERTRIIGHVNWLAFQAGWKYDTDLIWTCPPCQEDDAWKARQGQVEVHRGAWFCARHDVEDAPGARPDDATPCTCPGAVLAVDVMLASEDHLGSGRGRHAGGQR